ncbi:ABC transporter permease [Malikia spinosa]|jgi:inositol transport system permease protein|uniref:ABC transporter n=1 Tax=Malikia spinosa TaxID=86180 RepID=A0A2S9KBQ9_9BURK|nr:ABC transporter permease [Malikia spinosa]MYZ52834.1 ABC transporter permease [Malikia spinosa]OGB68518.1 MAG: ABC transporter [Burkholderiales bacterium RIFOXYC12_FULL_65_23]PRD67881.1 ABC transporter [Malikia spinosa]
MSTTAVNTMASLPSPFKFKLPQEASIFLVLLGIGLLFEGLGWYVNGQSFLFNLDRLQIIILQMAVIGIIAIGVNLVIITSGIDLSSGSVVAAAAVVSASLAQVSDFPRAVFPALTDLPIIWPIIAGALTGLVIGCINGSLIAYTMIPPFIATLGTMVAARGFAKWFTGGMPVSMLTDDFAWIGSGANPVIIFLVLAVIFHVVLRHTRFGKFTYAIGANRQAAIVSGINVNRHLIWIYTIAGLLAGIAGTVTAARAISGQSGMGVMYELDAIAAVVIGGTSLVGGKGRITGTVIGVLILGVMTSGFTFIRIDAYYQEMVKGAIIVAAVVADQYRNKKKR